MFQPLSLFAKMRHSQDAQRHHAYRFLSLPSEFTQTKTIVLTHACVRFLTLTVLSFSLRWVPRVALLSGSDERLTSVGSGILSCQQGIAQAHMSVMMRVHVSLRRRWPIVFAEITATGIYCTLLLLLTRLTLLLTGRLLTLAWGRAWARDWRGGSTGRSGGCWTCRRRAGRCRRRFRRRWLERALLQLMYLVRWVILISVMLKQV